ncbi:MAG: hypothetical protein AAFX85_05805 [Pseudomonadota bacterium]
MAHRCPYHIGLLLATGTGAHRIGKIDDRRLREVSGLVVSPSDPQRLWVINDSGNAPRVHLLTGTGERLASVELLNARNRDWEDLAVYRDEQGPMLVVGDVGDNGAVRPYVSLYFVREPVLEDGQNAAAVAVDRVVHLRYPNGPRDVEGLAIDEANGEVLLLSKRTTPPVLYAVPLAGESGSPREPIVARVIGPVATIPPPSPQDLARDPVFGIYASQPTALDYRADVGLLVLTYARPYLFLRRGAPTLAASLDAAPIALEMPRLQQAEAAAFDAHATSVIVTSEKLPAPLLRLPFAEEFRRNSERE